MIRHSLILITAYSWSNTFLFVTNIFDICGMWNVWQHLGWAMLPETSVIAKLSDRINASTTFIWNALKIMYRNYQVLNNSHDLNIDAEDRMRQQDYKIDQEMIDNVTFKW